MDTPEEADGYDALVSGAAAYTSTERLVELGAVGRVLDIGTGPGHIPLLVCAAIPGTTVVGVDLARHMLAHAERHRAASPHADRVSYRLADAKGLDFADGSFYTVCSKTVLHDNPDPRPFLAEA